MKNGQKLIPVQIIFINDHIEFFLGPNVISFHKIILTEIVEMLILNNKELYFNNSRIFGVDRSSKLK